MKILRPAVFTVLGLAATTIDDAAGTNGVGAYYEDSTCTETLLANIDSGECQDDSGCKAYQSSGISMFCVNDATEYLKTAFGGSPYVVTEEYSDVDCTQPMLTRAFIADGECHVAHEDDGRTWSMTTTVGGDGTVAVLGTDNECGGANPYYHLDPVSKSDLNTGNCIIIPDSDGGNQSYSAKFYFVDSSTLAPPNTTTSTTDSSVSSTNDGTTTSSSDSPGSSTSSDSTTPSTDASSSSATPTPAATNATVGLSGTSGASNLLAVSLVLYATSVALGAMIL